ncbi:hypothetical protein [Lancefieldella rimae]|uniref:hypothetical protein n=1 Tax=Lancefieldella rimae TaxID=1383 RepID=UPI001CAB5BED|nr:hypothetical protein [Lancefieldella rimae]MBF4804082.1 hypothetical protein [Lancefieldella rimae]
MLTKQAREKIAERAKICDCLHFSGLYECLLGHSVPANTSNEEDYKVFLARLIGLCDTSDMVELPRDKDGKVIHIGDTVWCSGEKETVKAIEIRDSEARIHFVVPLGCESWSSPELITRAEPISDHESIARAIEDIVYRLNDAAASLKLQDIAMELRKLGDGNE